MMTSGGKLKNLGENPARARFETPRITHEFSRHISPGLEGTVESAVSVPKC
jgi:hypothetical protein